MNEIGGYLGREEGGSGIGGGGLEREVEGIERKVGEGD